MRGERYDPTDWSDAKVERWMEEFYRMREGRSWMPACENGHYDCSTRERGPCMDFVLSVAEDRGLEV